MFEPSSRYYALEDAEHILPDGRVVVYKRRRFLPQPESLETLVEVRIEDDSRLTDHNGDVGGSPTVLADL
ncbi:MAG: hypothetical protein R2867_26210 [Caldilineaceae bacterium]